MKRVLSFEIDCGDKTCASFPGKFCSFCRSTLRGNCTCYFFGALSDVDGWIQRHEECLQNASQIRNGGE